MAARLKNSLARTIKAHIALGALPDHDGDDDDHDAGDGDDDDDVHDDDDNNPPVRLFRARHPQLSSQACCFLFGLARLNQHVILVSLYHGFLACINISFCHCSIVL